ncbi:DUF4129 domain-containing protein [Paenibacillus solisilvae]|uniref:DUF4129 domain-containing protein n=1 Tax=Paenibacillus solisilvae TaxID=2486751 RepID=A0ABW0VWE4_9BACL
MTPFLRNGLSAAVAGMIELLLIYPVLFILYLQFPASGVPWQWLVLLWAGYPAGSLVNQIFKFRHSFPLLFIAILVGGCISWLFNGLSVEAIISAILLTFCLFRGEQMAVSSLALRPQARHYAISLFAYFFVSLFLSLKPDSSSSYPYSFTVIGVIVLVLTLFQLNRGNVNQESLSGSQKPMVEPTVRKHNRFYVTVILSITVMMVFTYQLQAALGSLFKTFRAWLAELLKGVDKGTPPPQTQPNETPPDLPLPREAAKTLPHWVDLLLYGLCGIIIAVLLWFVLRKLRYLPDWLRRLREKFAALFVRDKLSSAKGYVDEEKSIRKPGFLSGIWRSSSKEPRIRWKDLQDNESRIRYLYRQWVGHRVKSGYAFKPHLTPNETGVELSLQPQKQVSKTSQDQSLGDELIRSYNRVRYGGKTVSDEQLRLLLEQQEKGGR